MHKKATHSEVEELITKLESIRPEDFALALCHLESRDRLHKIHLKSKNKNIEQSSLFFARGLQHEMKNMYLQLARHLRARSDGSSQLMHRMFDFFSKTMIELTQLPQFNSQN